MRPTRCTALNPDGTCNTSVGTVYASYSAYTAAGQAGTTAYTYDPNGNLTEGAGRRLVYDPENRPTSITKNGVTTTFVYNQSGARIKKTVNSATEYTTTVYVGATYECTLASTGTTCSNNIMAGAQRLAVHSSGGATFYYHTDHLTSSSVITDSAGTVVQTSPTAPPNAATATPTCATNTPAKNATTAPASTTTARAITTRRRGGLFRRIPSSRAQVIRKTSTAMPMRRIIRFGLMIRRGMRLRTG